MTASIRRKAFGIQLMCGLSFAIFGVLAAAYSKVFIVGLLFSGVIAGLALMGLSCPHCGFPALFQEQKAFGMRFKAFSPWPPKKCRNCGRPL
jgi:hypothetical protein